MEKVKLRYEALQKALLTLQDGILTIEQTSLNKSENEYILLCDGLIQRFEYCIDAFWKFIKLYLEKVDGASLDTTKPREILRIALGSIINAEEFDLLTDAISERNLTSHSYNEDLAAKIQSHIPAYLKVMKTIVDRMKID